MFVFLFRKITSIRFVKLQPVLFCNHTHTLFSERIAMLCFFLVSLGVCNEKSGNVLLQKNCFVDFRCKILELSWPTLIDPLTVHQFGCFSTNNSPFYNFCYFLMTSCWIHKKEVCFISPLKYIPCPIQKIVIKITCLLVVVCVFTFFVCLAFTLILCLFVNCSTLGFVYF